MTEPQDEAPVLQAPGQPIQPVVRRQRHFHHGGMDFPGVIPDAPGEMSPILLPSYIIGPPDVLQIDSLKGLVTQPVRGPHLVRPDGTVGIGAYGSATVAGLTIPQAREEIAKVIHSRLDQKVVKLQQVIDDLSVDVLAYNSKVYYVITDGGGYGEQVVRLPVTGNETVLDAISLISGLPPVASKKHIWIARRNPGMGGSEARLPVDWIGITQRGEATTNYQVMPGDRIYVKADRWHTANAFLGKVLAPVERILGITLLGSQTVNSIKSGQVGGGR
jgi:polysaccharide export outer membrane protein